MTEWEKDRNQSDSNKSLIMKGCVQWNPVYNWLI